MWPNSQSYLLKQSLKEKFVFYAVSKTFTKLVLQPDSSNTKNRLRMTQFEWVHSLFIISIATVCFEHELLNGFSCLENIISNIYRRL